MVVHMVTFDIIINWLSNEARIHSTVQVGENTFFSNSIANMMDYYVAYMMKYHVAYQQPKQTYLDMSSVVVKTLLTWIWA